MSVQIYVVLVVLLGLGASVFISRAVASERLLPTIAAYAALSIGLGLFLSFPLLQVSMQLCALLGVVKEKSCIRTDDKTVWFLAAPLVASPLYALVMLVARHGGSTSKSPASISPSLFRATVTSALKRFRAGQPAVDRCPACQQVLDVKLVKATPGRESEALAVTCACGKSNGKFVVKARPAPP